MSVLIGRDREVSLIKTYIKEMKSFHIYGPEGVGKTALLDHIYSNWDCLHSPLIPVFCRTSRTFREILLCIVGFLLNHFKHLQSIDKFKRFKEIRYPTDIKKLSIRALKNVIFAYISQDRFCIILDHLEHVTPKINALLTPLKGYCHDNYRK